MLQTFHRLNLLTLVLTFCLIVLGAYVRLSHAGLGCPDWPGCYGHIGVPDADHEVAAAEAAYPERPVEAPKAWKEMVHRYLAGIVGLLIGALAVLAWRDRSGRLPRSLATATVGVVLMQIVFGALTVTWKVKPIIVTTHLLLGLTTLSLVFWMWLGTRAPSDQPQAAPLRAALLKPLSIAALLLLCCQIFLGGWTSTNYAALACPDFPACHGSFAPKGELGVAFKLWHGLGIDYEGGILDVAARATIHLVHRYGALVLSLVLIGIAAYLLSLKRAPYRQLALVLLGALALQVLIGIGLIHLQLPLWLADAHNAGAALLLLAVLALNYTVWHGAPPRPGQS
ncbi:heme A synthase [uncultured Nevskia sp.]|uniref:COX15/CtaA family protein n=1 Tax=uncultured Nevskia sp. TaxID=228950 RepID=UPI0025E6D4AB|nr:COX15/CtaA family protein [uncultured Nevskia sp.]